MCVCVCVCCSALTSVKHTVLNLGAVGGAGDGKGREVVTSPATEVMNRNMGNR